MLARESRVQPPALDTYSDMPLFNTKAVVRQTGVPAPTLRAWERRYGILAPRRGENAYRLYSERDMAVVLWLRDRVESGLTISQAIALLRSLEPARRPRRRTRGAQGPVTHEAPESALGEVAPAPEQSRSFSIDDLSERLLSQFINLDESAATRTIAQAFAVYPLEDVCLTLFTPTLIRLGEMWERGEVTVTVEHFSTAIIRAQLESLFRSSPNATGPLTLVGCAPGELHELGALMLALFLRRAGLRVAYLGQSVELESLMSAIQTARPAGVLLSATLRPQAETLMEVGQRLSELGARQPAFFFGGQAFAAEPELAQRVTGSYLGLDAYQAAEEIKHRLIA